MVQHEGFYYYCESRNQHRSIVIRRSRTIAGIGNDPGICVWNAPASGPNSAEIWAPELHFIGNRWFIYYAADDGDNDNHRMWVLESEGADARGKYHCRGQLQTGGWAIDGTVLTLDDGRMFFIWSGWPGPENGRQELFASAMSDPLTLAGSRVRICAPDQPWEQSAMPICEGPSILKRNGDLFIVYSASGSWTADYCLGLLRNRTGDVLNPAAWEKRGPVFRKTEGVWGVGHCSFVKSLCGTEDWMLYHAKSLKAQGWTDREVHAKRFIWTPEGLPDFGVPAPRDEKAPAPANLEPFAPIPA